MNKELIKKIEQIQKDLNDVLRELKGETNDNPLTLNFSKAINKTICDTEYIDALSVLNKLQFKLSVKQFSYIVANARYHRNVGEQIVSFIRTQLKKCDDPQDFVDSVSVTLKKCYVNENNQEYIESLIQTLKNICNEL